MRIISFSDSNINMCSCLERTLTTRHTHNHNYSKQYPVKVQKLYNNTIWKIWNGLRDKCKDHINSFLLFMCAGALTGSLYELKVDIIIEKTIAHSYIRMTSTVTLSYKKMKPAWQKNSLKVTHNTCAHMRQIDYWFCWLNNASFLNGRQFIQLFSFYSWVALGKYWKINIAYCGIKCDQFWNKLYIKLITPVTSGWLHYHTIIV